MTSPLLTIGIPVYNGRKALEKLLPTILEQLSGADPSKIEILISDNASVDGTGMLAADYLAAHPGLFSYYRNDANIGFDGNIDSVMRRAKGRYVWLLGCGERVKPGALATIMAELEKNDWDNVLLNFDIYSEKISAIEAHSVLGRGETKVYTSAEEFLASTKYSFTPLSANIVSRDAWLEVSSEPLVEDGWGHVERLAALLKRAAYRRSLVVAPPCFVLYRELDGWWSRDGNLLVNSVKLRFIISVLFDKLGYDKRLKKVMLDESYKSMLRAILQSKYNGLRLSRDVVTQTIRTCRQYPSFWIFLLPLLLVPSSVYLNRVFSAMVYFIRDLVEPFLSRDSSAVVPAISNKKNYFYTLTTSVVNLGVSGFIGFISVPISLNYWRPEKYGVWAIISSVLIYLSFSGMGLNTAAAVLMAKNKSLADKFIILKRAVQFMVIGACAALCAYIGLNLVSEDWIFILGKIPDLLKRETYLTCFIVGAGFLLNLPFSLLASILHGFQKTYVENVFITIQNLLNFICLLLAIYFERGLVVLAVLISLSNLGLSIFKFWFVSSMTEFKEMKKAGATGKLSDIYEVSTRHILVTGWRFTAIGVASLIVWNTDNFIISNFIGVKAVTPYAVTFKLYTLLFGVITLVNNSVLTIMARELGNENWDWINTTYKNLSVVSILLGGGAWVIGLYLFRDVVYLWAGEEGYGGLLSIFALGGYAYVISMANLNAGIINYFNYTKGAAFISWLEAGLKFAYSLLLLQFFGIGGVALGTLLAAVCSTLWILPRWISKCSGHRIIISPKFAIKHFLCVIAPILVCGVIIQSYTVSPLHRSLFGVLAIGVYITFSYFLIPDDIKVFLREMSHKIVHRLKRSGKLAAAG